MRGFRLLLAGLIVAAATTLSAQEFEFGTDLIDGVESGRVGGGFATAYMDFAIDGNQLTAILRNTSPEAENFGADPLLQSPAIRRVDFNITDIVGDAVDLLSWEMTAVDDTQASVVLGSDARGGVDQWRAVTLEDGTFRFKSRGAATPQAPLYNPEATGGFGATAIYYTEAVLTATFNATIGASDLNPEVRFKYLGSGAATASLSGIELPAPVIQPEPASLLVWAGLIGAIGYRWRRVRRNR